MTEKPSVISRMGHSRAQAVAAYRRRDRAALASLVASKLTAYRATTVYGGTLRSLRKMIDDEVLPRLVEADDVRVVQVDRWEKEGPTVSGLTEALHEQLELGAIRPSLTPSRAQEEALARAMRRSERPIVIVLYGVDKIESGRDPLEERCFVDALARIAGLSVKGVSLLMVVEERNLGIFRELLRGRWQLLVHDVRIPEGEGIGLLPTPLVTGGTTVATAGGAAAGGVVGKSVATAGGIGLSTILAGVLGLGGLGVGAYGVYSAGQAEAALEDCRKAQASLPECRRDPGSAAAAAAEGEPAIESDETVTPLGATTEGDTVTTGDATGEVSTGSSGDPTTGEPGPLEPKVTTATATASQSALCEARGDEGTCATCVRAKCCTQLRACRSRSSRKCVIEGTIGAGECSPEKLEKSCRALALCALEYDCQSACFDK